jgi:hypothetical protein
MYYFNIFLNKNKTCLIKTRKKQYNGFGDRFSNVRRGHLFYHQNQSSSSPQD